jgi:sulfur carrier protein
MIVTVNGQRREVAAGSTVAQLVDLLTRAPAGVAVAVNDAVVRRGDWASTVLGDADRVEILTAVQGG